MSSLWDEIRDPQCRRCGLYQEAQCVCLIGTGAYPTDVMFVGEAPGFREDDIKKPFSGKAGKKVLDPILGELGIKRSEVFITNACHCRPPGNRTPTRDEIKACQYFLNLEMEKVRPEKIVCLGLTAAKSLLDKFNISLKAIVGRSTEIEKPWGKVKVYFTYHPAKVLREPGLREYLKQHLKLFLAERKRFPSLVAPWDYTGFLSDYRGSLAIDIETEKINDENGGNIDLLSIAVSCKKGKGYWVDVENDKQMRELMGLVKCRNSIIVGHNLKFDLKELIKKGVLDRSILKEDRFFDTLIAYNILDENCPDKSLKALALTFTTMPQYEIPEDFSWGNIDWIREYNGYDSDATWRLRNYTLAQLERTPSLWIPFKIDMRCTAVLVDMELRGVKVDIDALERMSKTLTKKLQEVSKYIPVENPRSPKQVASMLMKMGFELPMTDKGNPKADEATLQMLGNYVDSEKKKRVLQALLEYRFYYKLKSTFVEGIKEVMDKEYFVHPTYFIAKRQDYTEKGEEGGTTSGRLSSKRPNFQNIPRDKEELPKEISPRSLFIPRSRLTHLIASSDFTQAEVILAGIYYDEPKILSMYESGEDLHQQIASEVFGVKFKNVTKDQRKAAKAVVFGVLYGQTEFGLSRRLGWSEQRAREFIRAFFKKFPDLKKGIDEVKHFIIKNGYVESYFKRRRRLPGASDDTPEGRELLRQGINAPIQGGAADLCKIAMYELFKHLDSINSFIIGQIHDEIVCEIDKKKKKAFIELVSTVFSNPPLKEYGLEPFPVKMRGETEIGENFLELTESYQF